MTLKKVWTGSKIKEFTFKEILYKTQVIAINYRFLEKGNFSFNLQ